MVTKSQIDRLGARIEQLAAVIDPTASAITVAVFSNETPAQALERHCELRPEHKGRRVQYAWQPHQRRELHELSATWAGSTQADFEKFRRAFG